MKPKKFSNVVKKPFKITPTIFIVTIGITLFNGGLAFYLFQKKRPLQFLSHPQLSVSPKPNDILYFENEYYEKKINVMAEEEKRKTLIWALEKLNL
ncbi:hypothetical protein SNEBB_000490 [Seison nebaliae]|nr:hypothetical protein SNEBB_000490 [Seison nebaliae]